jgi:hypothetical protein
MRSMRAGTSSNDEKQSYSELLTKIQNDFSEIQEKVSKMQYNKSCQTLDTELNETLDAKLNETLGSINRILALELQYIMRHVLLLNWAVSDTSFIEDQSNNFHF